jgi:hypothetical protein
MFMREAKNHGELERLELLEYVNRTLAHSLSGLPASEGTARACVFLLKHLIGDQPGVQCPKYDGRLFMGNRITDGESEFVVT